MADSAPAAPAAPAVPAAPAPIPAVPVPLDLGTLLDRITKLEAKTQANAAAHGSMADTLEKGFAALRTVAPASFKGFLGLFRFK